MTMSGFDMIFRAIGIDPNAFVEAIREIQGMALSIAQKTAATDAKMERIERKLDLLMKMLDVKLPEEQPLIEHHAQGTLPVPGWQGGTQ
jgi:hypothetical protein